MPKLIILRGLPASGKSTRAKEIMESAGNVVRINKDLLRKMLHFDKWSGKNERYTKKASKELAAMFLKEDRTVIIDDTNLTKSALEGWKSLAIEMEASHEVIDIDTPYEECLDNDIGREGEVGKAVIDRFAFMSTRYPMPYKPFIVSDIDGTIADLTHRLHFSKGDMKDWDKFFSEVKNDKPRKNIIEILNAHREDGYEVIFVSGRPERCRRDTLHWMWKNGVVAGGEEPVLFMRQDGDHRPDTQVKSDIYDTFLVNYPIERVYDDRPRVIVDVWLPRIGKERVEDVGSNEFFVEEREELNYWTDETMA